MKRELIGKVGVDSGQLLITDPCYITSQWKNTEFEGTNIPTGEFSYDGCCQATLSKKMSGQLNYNLGHPGVGVAFSSGYGDGVYPVYAKKDAQGRIVEVIIKMD